MNLRIARNFKMIFTIVQMKPTNKVIRIFLLTLLFVWGSLGMAMAQTTEKAKEAMRKAEILAGKAADLMSEGSFEEAETLYRKSIAVAEDQGVSPYNLGNAYYQNESMGEAFLRFKEASEELTTKEERHKAFHNMGNVFMKNKEYDKAVEAYKEALRNNPDDEETRYNLALAKDMLEKNPPQAGGNDDENKDEKQQQDQQQDQQQPQQGEQQEQDQGKGDPADQGEQQKQPQPGEGENKEKQQAPEQSPEGQGKQPQKEGMSPQQVKNLLEAMNKEEQKVLDKMKAKRVQGKPSPNEKDW